MKNTLTLTPQDLQNHLLNNQSLCDYNLNCKRDLFSFEGLKTIINVDKIDSRLLAKIENNFKLANERINVKLSNPNPSVGDYFIVNNEVFRIAITCNDSEEFQYTKSGSFYLNKQGDCSYSGGFSFDHGSTFKFSDLEPTKELKKGSFWFFSDNSVKAHNGVHFDMDFKVWKLNTL